MKKLLQKLGLGEADNKTASFQNHLGKAKDIFNLARIIFQLIKFGEILGLPVHLPEIIEYLDMGIEVAEVLWHIIKVLIKSRKK